MLHAPGDSESGLLRRLGEIAASSVIGLALRRLLGKDRPQGSADDRGSAPRRNVSAANDQTQSATLASLTAGEIFATISSAPPMQAAAAGKRFEGKLVESQVYFAEGRKLPNGMVRLAFDAVPDGDGKVICTIALNRHPKLEYLRRGSPVRISGIVSRAREHAITIRQAELFIPFGTSEATIERR
jgi:hypothetical protein